jgi:hypothetical protein
MSLVISTFSRSMQRAGFIPRSKSFGLSKADGAKFVFGSVLIALAIFRTAASEWSALTQRFWAGGPLSYGIEYDIADFHKEPWD